MSKIAMYMRLSVEEYGDKIESESISSQRLLITDYIIKDKSLRKLEREEYIDDGYSGTNTNRPDFNRLLNDVRDNKIYCIIVKDLSRFLRDYILIGDYLENIFPFMNVRFISINDGYDSEKERGNGTDLSLQFRSLLYDFYSKDVSDKVRTSMSIQRRQGKFLGWSPPIGYMKDPNNKHKIIIDEKTADVVRYIFDLSIKGMSTRKIASLLNKEGYKLPSHRKSELTNMRFSQSSNCKDKNLIWTNGCVIDILNNENYTGTYMFERIEKSVVGGNRTKPIEKEKWGRVYNNHEPIVSYEIFNESKRVRALNNRFKKKNTDYEWYKKSPLQKYVRCSKCGHILSCESTKRKRKDGTIIEHRYFRCRICKLNNDESNTNKADVLEDKVYELIKEKFETTSLVENAKVNEKQGREDLLDSIKESEGIKKIAYEKYRLKKIGREEFLTIKSEKDRELEVLNNSLKELEKVSDEDSGRELEDILTKEMVEKYLEAVYVFRNEITEIRWKEDIKGQ